MRETRPSQRHNGRVSRHPGQRRHTANPQAAPLPSTWPMATKPNGLPPRSPNRPCHGTWSTCTTPCFTAGPHHKPFLASVLQWSRHARCRRLSAVFSGHEHNLQFSERNPKSATCSSSFPALAGRSRNNSVRKRMPERHIAAPSAQRHFLVVHITGRRWSSSRSTSRPSTSLIPAENLRRIASPFHPTDSAGQMIVLKSQLARS